MVGTRDVPAVELRPIGEDDLSLLEKLTQDPDLTGEFQWFGWRDLRCDRQVYRCGDHRLGIADAGDPVHPFGLNPSARLLEVSDA